MTVLLHQRVDRFEIRDFLGRGAIGDVLLAWDPERGSEIALKVVRVSKTDPEMLEAEKNGIALQAQLAQAAPQVAAVYEQGQDGDLYWVAMEYVAGTDLSRLLAKGPLPEDMAVGIAHQLCSMLEVCHEFTADVGERRIHGIVHGDIKPENIRLQDGDRVRVLDFGIAKHLSQTRRFTVNLFGSLPFTPPERLDRGVVDRHSDLWAVGVVLYIMVSGRRPFAGNTPEEVEQRILREPPLPLPDFVSPRLQRIIRRSLAFEVERRYPTAAELRADLEAVRDDLPLAGEAVAGEDLNATRRTARPAADFDSLDATRRTDRPASDGTVEATRRTGEAAEAASTAVPPPPPFAGLFPEVETAAAEPRPRPRRRRWGPALLGLLLVALGASQYWVRGQAEEIRHELVTGQNPDLQALAERFRRVERYSVLPSGAVQGTREELREALIGAADRIIESYHGDSPVTTQRGWQRAYEHLRAAVDLKMLDRKSRARMVYCRAHLDRIEAQILRERGETTAAAEKIREAVSGFRKAALWDPSWPDPYLGLARIYAYEQFDLDKLQEALGELGKHGYRLGRREKAMLADGFRMRGREIHARALRSRGTEDEARLLERARDHLQEAVALYDEIPGYANVRTNRADCEARLLAIQARFEELEGPSLWEEIFD